MFTRVPDGYKPSERRRGLILVAVGIAAVYLFLTALSTIWTDYLWFDSVEFTDVWWIRWRTSILLGVAGAVVAFLVVWLNLLLVDRFSPRYEPLRMVDDEEDVVARFREWVEPRTSLLRLLIAAAFAIMLGLGVAGWRDEILLFLNGGSFGEVDPLYGNDLGFYLFRYPVWDLLLSWIFNLLLLTLLLSAGLYYLSGGIEVRRGSMPSMSRAVKAHLSILAALLAITRAVMYRFDALDLVFSQDGYFGAGYTDVNAKLPALSLLALVAILAAVLFIVNIFREGWTLAIVSMVGWIFVSIGASVVYPAIVQRFTVQPNELARERPYIERNIAATRAAYGIDEERVEVREFAATTDLTAEDVEANQVTIDNLRLWDPEVINRTYQQLQEIRQYYRVDRVDTDRYQPPDGTPTQAMVALRELDEPNIPADDWQNQRLAYTHGLGAVLSPANAVLENGQPDFLLRDVPPVTALEGLELTQPRVYFGETYDPNRPVIVRTGESGQEIDFPTGGEEGTSTLNQYDGAAGVELSNVMKRLAFALRYRDLNILISSQLRTDSRMLMERNIVERVNQIAPFLAADADPYPVILDGRIIWVLDLYTLSDRYPYSQPIGTRNFATDRLSRRSQLPLGGFNYIRNSVKATVDAYDGTMRFYVVDPTDPVVEAWRAVYPTIFLDMDTMPQGLERHLRYPQDLFIVQSELYLDYHMVDSTQFFQRSDAWSFPQDPSTIRRSDLLRGDRRSATDLARVDFLRELQPSYLLITLPGEPDLTYGLMQPFNPEDKPNMASFLVADSTPGRYGRLIDFRMPRGSLVEGTGQVGNRIDQDDEISQQFTLWRGQGSTVVLGDMLVVPVEDSIMYVQPVYLEAEAGGIPEFRRVVVAYGDVIEWDSSLDVTLEKVFGEAEGGGETPEPEQPPGEGTAEELLGQAAQAFEEARNALRQGDLALYQEKVEEAERLVEEARLLLGDGAEARSNLLGVQ